MQLLQGIHELHSRYQFTRVVAGATTRKGPPQ